MFHKQMTSVTELINDLENHSIDDKNYCGICSDEISSTNIIKLSCGHDYCYECIYDWFFTRISISWRS